MVSPARPSGEALDLLGEIETAERSLDRPELPLPREVSDVLRREPEPGRDLAERKRWRCGLHARILAHGLGTGVMLGQPERGGMSTPDPPTPEEVKAALAVLNDLLQRGLDTEVEIGPAEVDAVRVLHQHLHLEALRQEREREDGPGHH
jgi:hypothetical protein